MYAKILLTAWIALVVINISMYVFPGDRRNESISRDKEAALEDCLEAVQEKCGPVIEYAAMLEKENAKLNQRLKACREK